MIENRYKVDTSRWDIWSDNARIMFNQLYTEMIAQKALYLHPYAFVPVDRHWKTTCWNCSWTAADIVDGLN